jgi:hypothetical protein
MNVVPELKEKLERCRELMAHRLKADDTNELIELLAEEYLKKNDPLGKNLLLRNLPRGRPNGRSKNPPKNRQKDLLRKPQA